MSPLTELVGLILDDMPAATIVDLACDGGVGNTEGMVWAAIERKAKAIRELADKLEAEPGDDFTVTGDELDRALDRAEGAERERDEAREVLRELLDHVDRPVLGEARRAYDRAVALLEGVERTHVLVPVEHADALKAMGHCTQHVLHLPGCVYCGHANQQLFAARGERAERPSSEVSGV